MGMDVNAIIATAESMEPAPSVAELTIPPELASYEDEADDWERECEMREDARREREV